MKAKFTSFPTLLVLLLPLSACLKTRAQLKGDDEAPSSATTRVEPVKVDRSAVDEMREEINRLHGKIVELERSRNDADLKSEQEKVKKLEGKITELEQSQSNLLSELKRVRESVPPMDPAQLLAKGKKQMGEGEFEDAIQSFTQYLEADKQSDKQSKNRGDATFLRAESQFELKNYKKAIEDYSQFVEDHFPKSAHKPKALFKMAQSFEKIGFQNDAVPFYQELLDRFPKSSEAKEAKKRLSLLNKGSSKKKSG